MKKSVVIALCLLSAGCSWLKTEDKKHLEPLPLQDITASVTLDDVWSRDIGDVDLNFSRLEPSLSGDTLYVAENDGQVLALNASSGRVIWEKDVDDVITGGAGVGVSQVYVGTRTGEVVALAANSGAELWRTQLSTVVVSSPRDNGEVVAVQTIEGRIYGLSAGTGEELWKYDVPIPKLTQRGTSSPVITDAAIYAGFASGKVIAFKPSNGIVLWENRVSVSQGNTDLDKMTDVDTDPVIDGGIIYAASYQGRVAAITRANGRGRWARDVSTYQNISVENGRVFLTTADSAVVAYNAASGDELWRNEDMLRRRLTGPINLSGTVLVGDMDGYVHALDQASGAIVGRIKVDGSGVQANLISNGEMAFILGNSGELTALSVK